LRISECEVDKGLGVDLPAAGGHWRSWGLSVGGKGRGGGAPSEGDFSNFSKNNTFYAYFGKSSCKTITHQLKVFKISLNVLNGINKVLYKFCNIRINVTKYDVTFATKGDLTPNQRWALGTLKVPSVLVLV